MGLGHDAPRRIPGPPQTPSGRPRRDLRPGGVPALAEALRLPARPRGNFEAGATIPGGDLLKFIALTGCDPQLLLTGQGRRYSRRAGAPDRSDADKGGGHGARDTAPDAGDPGHGPVLSAPGDLAWADCIACGEPLGLDLFRVVQAAHDEPDVP